MEFITLPHYTGMCGKDCPHHEAGSIDEAMLNNMSGFHLPPEIILNIFKIACEDEKKK